jgi:hypothetical protein
MVRRASTLRDYQIYHNYLKPHEGLDGETLAGACGIGVQGDNSWVTLIQTLESATGM